MRNSLLIFLYLEENLIKTMLVSQMYGVLRMKVMKAPNLKLVTLSIRILILILEFWLLMKISTLIQKKWIKLPSILV